MTTEDNVHIGFFTDGYTPQLNGVATNIQAVTGALEAQGHRVSIFAPAMGHYADVRGQWSRHGNSNAAGSRGAR